MPVKELPGVLGDFHCHTIASQHAYSTLRENLEAAKRKGLRVLAVTDHAIGMADSPPLSYFENLTSLPKQADGVRLLRGVEANVMDLNGSLDMPDHVLAALDIVIASFHTNCVKGGTVEDHTRAYLNLARNPYVHIIGHSGSVEFEYNYERVIPEFGKNGKIVEINAHTFICRQQSVENCRTIARICAKHNLSVLVNSDAHSEFEVGECGLALQMLQGIGFPPELIINTDVKRMEDYLAKLAGGAGAKGRASA